MKRYKEHQCQHCGSERKLVETAIDDEFVWNEEIEEYEPVGFGNDFEHTGRVRCAQCEEDWTGL